MMSRSEILAALNDRQGEAASTVNGPVLVLAGAGTGKTRVITYRIAYMLATGVPAESILGLTFTNKAAREMRERLDGLVGEMAKNVTLGTFHSFCGRILRREISKLGYLPSFTIADESDQFGTFKQAAGRLGCNGEGFHTAEAFAMISHWKNRLMTPAAARRDAGSTNFQAISAAIYEEYQAMLEEQNQVDFDDMLLLVWRLFSEHPDVLEMYKSRYRYLLVDEYQDTNYAQYEILRMLGGEHPNLCVVGDDDQSIYSWRGADIDNILDFPDRYPAAKVVRLEQNYRSTGAILGVANEIIGSGGGRRHEKKLWSAEGFGEIPKVVTLDSGEAEASFIGDVIEQKRHESGARYSDFAILYRSNAISRQIETTLRSCGIPYRVYGGQPFFQRQEIKNALAYLGLIVNPQDDQSLLRVLSTPPRGLGGKTADLLRIRRTADHKSMLSGFFDSGFLSKLSSTAAAGAEEFASAIGRAREAFSSPCNLAAKTASYLEDIGYTGGLQRIYKDIKDAKMRRENVDEFINGIAQYEKSHFGLTLQEYLDSCSLLEQKDKDSETEGDAVVLSTVHAAKGLEFPVVFVAAVETGIFPHERAIEEGSMDEEKRLFYVAVTRARKELFLLRARKRMQRGVTKPAMPSPFLAQLGTTVDRCDGEDIVKPVSDEDLHKAFEDIFEKLRNLK
ncbi:MAG: UvrD-helicase domain-containing protein [Victivallaceae bacterium]|nr:UvrD-helicase domain-containing protein [Victivallaceae bacterium]